MRTPSLTRYLILPVAHNTSDHYNAGSLSGGLFCPREIAAMFIAKLMICGMLQGDCGILTDTRGLHKSEKQCRARIEKMVTDLRPIVPNMRMLAKCKKLGVPV